MSASKVYHKSSPQLRQGAKSRLRAKEINRRFSLFNDPIDNLKMLLYGQESLHGIEDPNVELDYRGVSKIMEGTSTYVPSGSDSTKENLLRRQDAYIEQLERENSTLKVELGNIRGVVQEIISENQQLTQSYQMPPTFPSHLPDQTHIPTGMKGLSDEEKISGQNVKTNVDFNDQREIPIDRDQISMLIRLRRENEDMVAIIGQLEHILGDMRKREEAAQIKVKQGIVLVEQAQYEKIQALVDRDKLKEENEMLKMNSSQVVKDCQEKLEDVEKSVLKSQKRKCEEEERELSEARQKLAETRICLEKVEGEKIDLQHRLHKAEKRLGLYHEDMQQMAEKMQEEITKALTERNIAIQDQAQIKVKWSRARHEHQKELLWSKLELREIRKRVEEAEERHAVAKSELVRIGERNRSLEKKLEWTEQWASQEIRGKNEEISRILQSAKTDEEEWGKLLHKHSQRHKELEKMIELQTRLVDRFKIECRHLEKRVENIKEHDQNSSGQLKMENNILMEKLKDTGQACKQLENLCGEHNKRQLTMKEEFDRQNQNVVRLLAQQNMLMKERQLLHQEMDFLWQKFNAALK